MIRKTLNLFVLLSILFLLPASSTLAAEPARASTQTETEIPLDVPVVIVADGVMTYDIASPKIFWYGREDVACIPTDASSGNAEEWIYRVPTYGGTTRQLWLDTYNPVCGNFDVDMNSNLIADTNSIYWMSDSQNVLVHLSEDANVGDTPEVLSSGVSGFADLTQDTDHVYVLQSSGLRKVSKADGTTTLLTAAVGSNPTNPQTDGIYVYWMTAGNLKRLNLATNFIATIGTGVSGYYPEGRLLFFCFPECTYTEYVFIGKGDQIDRYNNIDGANTTIYTSSDSSAIIYKLATTGSVLGLGQLFFFESREVTCNPFCNHQVYLMRRSRGTGGTTDVLYASAIDFASNVIDSLQRDGDYLFWQENGGISRLPTNAEALPLTNMEVTGIEVNQALQDPSNSVRLIKDKRTFVRVYVSSDGPPVSGVGAYLYRTDSGGTTIGAGLTPVNPVGQQITVKSWANRMDINQSFLFELPMSWVTTSPLRLKAVLNPWQIPPESSYTDNSIFSGPLTLSDSPRLGVYFVSFGYTMNNTTYYPHLIDDVFQAYSWIRRAYPLSSTPGGFFDPGQGFRPNLWIVYDEGLGSRVNQTATECNKSPFYYTNSDGELVDDRSLCASAYTNNLLNVMRIENDVPSNIFMYGMIADPPGSFFPRGQASGNVSSGPAGPGDWGWDFDGSYADWYAGHEIGHTLGRAHPDPNSDDPATDAVEGCGHSRSDPNYPYNNAMISDGAIEGFDVGDAGLNPLLQPAVLPGIFWFDMMSYCDNQWISDYTYDAMYDYMLANPTSLDTISFAKLGGDFLSVFGFIEPESNAATIQHLSHLFNVSEIPPLVDGDYIIRLKNAGGSVLADYRFTPTVADEGQQPYLTFGQVVDFVAGTTTVEILDDGENVLTSKTLSANPPVISNVALQGAPNPVVGTVTLAWTTSDPDGDPLTFDIFYSVDNGATFQPLLVDVEGSSAQIDTSLLGGSNTALLRVVVSDGVHTAQGDTAPFDMDDKPPQVFIQSPADGATFHYDQSFNLTAMTFDVQDGAVAEFNLQWTDQAGVLGYTSFLSLSQLSIGVHEITLTATNSKGLSATDTITITIDDDLELPGPTLSVAPGLVNWHVGTEAVALQTADLLIDNVGGGGLPDWTATENASWLTLSASSGVVSSTITLTADPTGVEPGTVVSTIVTITTPASGSIPAQTVEVLVTLAVGDVWHTFEQGGSKIYLPLITR